MRLPHLIILFIAIQSLVLIVQGGNISSALAPLDNRDCKVLWKAIKSILRATDNCIFLSTEHIDCPFHLKNQTMVVMTLETMFNGTVFKYQDMFYCDKIIVTFENFRVLRYFLRSRSLNNVFHPFTRIQMITLKENSRTGIMDSEEHHKQILFNAWYLYFIRVLNESFIQIEDGLTGALMNLTGNTDLDKQVGKAKRGYLLHPLFDYKIDKEFRVSLFHCPPYVIKLNNLSRIDR